MKNALLLLLMLSLLVACAPVDVTAPAPVFDTGIDPNSWVSIPSGSFYSGQFNQETNLDYEYEIMVTTVTNSQYATYLNEALASAKIKLIENQIVGILSGGSF